MKKMIISYFLIFAIMMVSLGNSSASAISADNTEHKQIYRYDVSSGEVTTVKRQDVITKKQTVQTRRTGDGEEVASVNPCLSTIPEPSPRHLLGSWTKINSPRVSAQYRSTVYITYTKNGLSSTATGFMIGPRAVATNGHVLYDPEHNIYASNLVVYPAYSNSLTPYGSANATAYIMNEGWTDEHSSEYDWAVIELDSNIGDSTGYLGLRWQAASYNGTEFMSNGYPYEVDGYDNYHMYRSTGYVTSTTDRKLYSTGTNSIDGMSGGPAYIETEGDYVAIALISGGTEDGTKNAYVRITQEVFDLFVSYRNDRA